MDAVEFVKTLGRMCNVECNKCEFWKRRSNFESCAVWQKNHPEEAVAIAEQWTVSHPDKTRQSVFLEHWPDADIDCCGVLTICPSPISTSHRNAYGGCANIGVKCPDCRREFWMQEVE